MSIDKKKYVSEKIKYIRESHSKYNLLSTKTERTEIEEQEKKEIEQTILKITESVNVVKNLPIKTLIELDKVITKSNNFVSGLDFIPTNVSNNGKTYSNDTGYSLLINYNNINNDKIISVPKLTKGIIDDITNFNNQPNVSITRQSDRNPFGGVIHTTPVGNEYIISFEFTLLRFPSKVYQNSLHSNQMKQLTTRRSELISFNYDNKSIEFAVMAPQGGSSNNTFKNNYSPFSIAVSFPFKGNCNNSIHTDYKFELNTPYLIKLRITSEDNETKLNNSDRLRYELFVNNTQENIIFTYGKVWNRINKKLKKNGIIPSQPGFLNMFNVHHDNTNPRFKISKEVISLRSNNFDFNKLNFIHSVPHKPLIKYTNISSSNVLNHYENIYNIHYKRYLYKLNNGVNFGKINIYYSKSTTKQA